MRIIITGGGTGGHIYPALAVARELKKRDFEILFIGTSSGLEAKLVPENGFDIRFINAKGLSSNPLKALKSLIAMSAGFIQSAAMINYYKPSLVVGTGGYVSAPVLLAAELFGVPGVILEQNIIPGKTTRLMSVMARKVLVSFDETTKYLPVKKVIVTGNPVREEIISKSRTEGRKTFQIPEKRLCVLVTGASQGAKSINEGIINTVTKFKDKDWTILHLTGEKNYQDIKNRTDLILKDAKLDYRCFGFMQNIADAYAACDLAICRAGATTIAEITARGIPSVIIPYPYSAESHQEKNASWLQDKGACRVIADRDVINSLQSVIEEMLQDCEGLKRMSENSRMLGKTMALDNILKVLENCLSNGLDKFGKCNKPLGNR